MVGATVAALVLVLHCLTMLANADQATSNAVEQIAPALPARWQTRLRAQGQHLDAAASYTSKRWAAESLQLRLLEAAIADLGTVRRPGWSSLAATAAASVLDRSRAEVRVADAERAALLAEASAACRVGLRAWLAVAAGCKISAAGYALVVRSLLLAGASVAHAAAAASGSVDILTDSVTLVAVLTNAAHNLASAAKFVKVTPGGRPAGWNVVDTLGSAGLCLGTASTADESLPSYGAAEAWDADYVAAFAVVPAPAAQCVAATVPGRSQLLLAASAQMATRAGLLGCSVALGSPGSAARRGWGNADAALGALLRDVSPRPAWCEHQSSGAVAAEAALALSNAAQTHMELNGVPAAWGGALLAVQVGADSVSTSTLSLEVHLRVAMRVRPRLTATRVIRLSEALLGPLSPNAVAGLATWPAICADLGRDGRLSQLRREVEAEPALLHLLNTRQLLGSAWTHSLNRTDALATQRLLSCLSPRSASRLGELAEAAQEQGSLVEASAAAAELARLLVARGGVAGGGRASIRGGRSKAGADAKSKCMAALALGRTEQARQLGAHLLSRRVVVDCGEWVRGEAGSSAAGSRPTGPPLPAARASRPLHVGYVTRDIASTSVLQRHPVASILLGLLRSHGLDSIPTVHYIGLASSLTDADLAATHETRRPGSIVEHLCAKGSEGCCPPGAPLAACTPPDVLERLCASAGLEGAFSDIACQATTLIHVPMAPASGSLYGDVCGAGPLDVVVDLQGLTLGMDPSLLRSMGAACLPAEPATAPPRLAPVVLESVGYLGSTGLSNVHYATADAMTTAVERAWAGPEPWFKESALLLPRAQQPPGPAYRRPRAAERQPMALWRPVVVASLVSARKSLESVTLAWGRALAVANSQRGTACRPGPAAASPPPGHCCIELWVRSWPSRGLAAAGGHSSAGRSSIVGTVAVANGFPPWCIRGVGHAPSNAEYLDMLAGVDVFLDSPVYGSHTTAIDAISQGASVLAWQGLMPQGRLPASIAAQSSREAGRSMVVRSAKELALVLRRMSSRAVADGLRARLLSSGSRDGTLFDLAAHGRAWQRALALVKETQASQASPKLWRSRHRRAGNACEGSRRAFEAGSGVLLNCEAEAATQVAAGEPVWRPLHVVVDPRSDWRRRQ